jgi:hypothetical protein
VHTWGKLGAIGYDAANVSGGGLSSPNDAKAVGDLYGADRAVLTSELTGAGPTPGPWGFLRGYWCSCDVKPEEISPDSSVRHYIGCNDPKRDQSIEGGRCQSSVMAMPFH